MDRVSFCTFVNDTTPATLVGLSYHLSKYSADSEVIDTTLDPITVGNQTNCQELTIDVEGGEFQEYVYVYNTEQQISAISVVTNKNNSIDAGT